MLLRSLTCWRCEREFKLLEEGDSESTSSSATDESLATLMDSFTCNCSLFTWSKANACKTPINQTKQLSILVFEVPLTVSSIVSFTASPVWKAWTLTSQSGVCGDVDRSQIASVHLISKQPTSCSLSISLHVLNFDTIRHSSTTTFPCLIESLALCLPTSTSTLLKLQTASKSPSPWRNWGKQESQWKSPI